MPPKKETPKKMTPKKVTKRTPSKGPSSSTPREIELQKIILFLWVYLKVSGATANMSVVADHFGIKASAASMRFARMKKRIEELEADFNEQRQAEEKGNIDSDADAEGDVDTDVKDGWEVSEDV